MSKRAAPSKTSPPPPASDKTSLREPNFIPLETVLRLPRNVKGHDIGQMDASVKAFGFLEPITVNTKTGRMIAGHGRVDYLQQQKAAAGKAPKGIRVLGTSWLVPVHYLELPADQEEPAALALNRTGELGGWDDAALASLLSDLAAQDALAGTGFDGEDVDRLLAGLGDSILGEQTGAGATDAVRVVCNVPSRVWLTMPEEVKRTLTAACEPLGIEITWPD